MPDISPLTEKHTSCTFNRDSLQNSGLKSVRSEHFKKFEDKLSADHEKLIVSKIKVDIDIFEKELKNLLEEEKHLLDQSHFQKKEQGRTLESLAQTKQ